jgi:hypothetical protein
MPKKLSVRNATILAPFPFFVTVRNKVVWMYPLKNFINHAYKHKACKFTNIVKKIKHINLVFISLAYTTQEPSV